MQTALPEPWRAALPDRSAPFCAELFPCTIFLRVVPGTTGRQYCIGTVRCSRKERLNVNNENQKRFVRPKRESGAVSQQGQNGQKQGGRKPAGRNPQKLGVKPPKANKPQQEQLLPVQQAAHKSKNQKKPKELRKTPVRIIPLGGLNEIGKNLTVVECANDMFLIDCGLAFPDSDMLGVDIVIPDVYYTSVAIGTGR